MCSITKKQPEHDPDKIFCISITDFLCTITYVIWGECLHNKHSVERYHAFPLSEPSPTRSGLTKRPQSPDTDMVLEGDRSWEKPVAPSL